ncbi:methionine ABC transporter permease [Enterococcus sp. LJL99]
MIANYLKTMIYYLPELTKALTETGLMLIISIAAAIIIGLPVGTWIYLLKQNNSFKNKTIGSIVNIVIDSIRSFPFLLLVVALIPLTRLVMGTAFGTLAAGFPLTFVSAALYARFTEQVLLDVPPEIIELAKALGCNRRQLIFRFLYVEARSGLVLMLTTVMISMISYSTVMGVVGGGGIGDFAIRYGYQRYEYAVMYTAIVIMILFVSFIQISGRYIAKKIDKKHL